MILYCYGTRPEYIKIKKLIELSKDVPHKVLFTSQHKDIADFKYDYKLDIKDGINRLDCVISSILSDNIEPFFNGVTHVLVQGDTATAFAVALAAYNRGVKVIHLEAGLRTYDKDNPYPEEVYRQFISRITDIHLCPTEQNLINLKKENVCGQVFVVGNTVLDNLDKEGTSYENIVLVTLHRRENHKNILEWFKVIEVLANKYPDLRFILPIHPNPNVSKHKSVFSKVEVVDPIEHSEFLKLLKKCKLIISDSGGIQEESSFFNKKVIVCRKVTERVESLDIHSFLCPSYLNLETMFDDLITNYEVNELCPYGDGHTSEKIIEILKKI